jgi:hypothetical protein
MQENQCGCKWQRYRYNEKALQRRARCKIITQTTMLSLIDGAKERGADDRVKGYGNTFHFEDVEYTADRLFAVTKIKKSEKQIVENERLISCYNCKGSFF